MGIFGSLIADRVLGPADETTGQRPGDPGGIANVALGMGSVALGAAAIAAAAPEMMANIRGAMDGLVSGGQHVGADPVAISAAATPAVPVQEVAQSQARTFSDR